MVRPCTKIENATTAKAIRDDVSAFHHAIRQGERERERQGAAQTAPDEDMLIRPVDLQLAPGEQGANRVDRQRRPGQHEPNGNGGGPDGHRQMLMRPPDGRSG